LLLRLVLDSGAEVRAFVFAFELLVDLFADEGVFRLEHSQRLLLFEEELGLVGSQLDGVSIRLHRDECLGGGPDDPAFGQLDDRLLFVVCLGVFCRVI